MLHRVHVLIAALVLTAQPVAAQDWSALEETRPPDPAANVSRAANRGIVTENRVLIAGDSWAQYMWDDGSHNDVFDRYGHDDRNALSRSLGSDPGPGYSGPEYAISGSEATHWADTLSYPWLDNVLAELAAQPTIDTVVLSIGGNDILRGRSEGGWYKDMDLDVPGSEAALIAEIRDDTFFVIDAILAVRPEMRVVVSSYDYPNFNVGFWCFLYACPKREDLSRDPVNDLITDAELNGMMITIEDERIDWANTDERIGYDNGVGDMHHYYGDGNSGPGVLPLGGAVPPDYVPFPGGNPLLPSLRSNFRRPGGIDADPIHLDFDGYQYKITNTANALFFPRFRGMPSESFRSEGGDRDGWTDGTTVDTGSIRLGDTGANPYAGIVSFDTSTLPANADITAASLYLMRHESSGSNPLTSGDLGLPIVDVATGSFGAPAVEAADATAPADASDAGTIVGSASGNGYAIRIDLDASGLAAINTDGLTQLRIRFDQVDGGQDYVGFRDGDGGATGGTFPALAEYLGSSAPLLDVTYEPDQTAIDDAGSPESQIGRLFRSMPNPFSASTSIQFALSQPGYVRLTIHDATGRHVRTLVDENLFDGTHNRTWDGANDAGESAANGIYFARLQTSAGTTTGKVVLVRQ